jgi:RNA polymerase sigma-70 factor (ECF subfamily)
LRLERESLAEVLPAAVADPPEFTADAEHRAARLREAIRELPRIYQTVIVLHYIEDQSTVEIAAILAIPAGTVRSRLHLARTILRRRLQKEFPDGL